MEALDRILQINKEKKEFLEDYLNLNAMLIQAAQSANTHDLQSLNMRKKRLVEAVSLIDQKLLESLTVLKVNLGVEDLAEANSKQHPDLKKLKIEAALVLKLMVEAKRSDESLKEKIDSAYTQLKGSKRAMDLNRIGYYTQEYFKEEEEKKEV